MIEDITFTYLDNNIKKECIIVDRFQKNNKNYLIYKEENNDELYAALYEIINNTTKIIPITDDKDYDVDKLISRLNTIKVFISNENDSRYDICLDKSENLIEQANALFK